MKNRYYDDFRSCELKTVVKEVIEDKGFYWHAFEHTLFYLDDTYQDSGYVNEHEVLKLKKENGKVYHLLSEKLEGEVFLVIHPAKRYRHAQNETLSTLMNVVLKSVYHCDCVHKYVSDFVMISRYKGKCLTNQQKNELQITLNGMIRDDFPVRIVYEKITGERQVGIGLFPLEKDDRIHVPSLKFIQMVKVLEVIPKEDEFVVITTCGDQMLHTIEKYYDIIKEASEILNCEPDYINTSIHRLMNKVNKS